MSLLHLDETTDDVVTPECGEHAEVHAGEHNPIEVRQPYHERGEAQHVDQAERHAQPTAVDQHDQRGDGQKHEGEQREVHPSVVTGLRPVDQDCRVDEGQN